jgi:uncharacterized protein (DUF3820 family)
MRPRTYGLTDTLDFGKYKGQTVAAIAMENPDYLLWALREVERFHLSTEDQLTVQESKYLKDCLEAGISPDPETATEANAPMSIPPAYTMTSTIGFGKYKGSTVQDVYNKNARYLSWLLDNVQRFTVSSELEQMIRTAAAEEEFERVAEASINAPDSFEFPDDYHN